MVAKQSANYEKFTEESVIITAKNFSRNVCKRENTAQEVESHWLFGKEKVPGSVISKEGHGDSLLGCESTLYYWLLWKRFIFKQCFWLPTHLA